MRATRSRRSRRPSRFRVSGREGRRADSRSTSSKNKKAKPKRTTLAGLPGNDKRLQDLIDKLERGKKCAERKQAVEALRKLGDARAVPALERARNRRVRGGFLNLQRKNANWCLKRDAEAAIAELAGKY